MPSTIAVISASKVTSDRPSEASRDRRCSLRPFDRRFTMNPLDVTMMQWGNRDAQAKSLLTLLKQPADAAALIINVPFGVDSPTYQPALDAMLDVRRDTHLPCYVISNLPEGLPLASHERLIAHGVIHCRASRMRFSVSGALPVTSCHTNGGGGAAVQSVVCSVPADCAPAWSSTNPPASASSLPTAFPCHRQNWSSPLTRHSPPRPGSGFPWSSKVTDKLLPTNRSWARWR